MFKGWLTIFINMVLVLWPVLFQWFINDPIEYKVQMFKNYINDWKSLIHVNADDAETI